MLEEWIRYLPLDGYLTHTYNQWTQASTRDDLMEKYESRNLSSSSHLTHQIDTRKIFKRDSKPWLWLRRGWTKGMRTDNFTVFIKFLKDSCCGIALYYVGLKKCLLISSFYSLPLLLIRRRNWVDGCCCSRYTFRRLI